MLKIKKYKLYFIIILMLDICFILFDNENYYNIKKSKKSIQYIIPINYIKGTIDYFIKNQSKEQNKPTNLLSQEDIKNNIKNISKQKNLIVFLIGESARANNFSLNGYEKDTNYFLKNLNIINFNNFYSCGTSTFISVPCIFSHLNRNDFSKSKFKKYTNLLDIFNDLNYDVTWFSNNGECKNVCDRINFTSLNSEYDDVLLEKLKIQVSSNLKKNKFIVLHSRGSHGPNYKLRYPENFEKFLPICNDMPFNCSKEELNNTYDNTIYYTSYIISEIIKFLKTQKQYNIIFIYVSDHGESLGENRQFMHGYNYFIANKYQKHVPFILWFSDNFIKNYNVDIEKLKNNSNNKYSQDNIFHSILGIFKIKTNYYDKNLDIFM